MQESEGVNGWRISSNLSCEYVTRNSMHTTKTVQQGSWEGNQKAELSFALDRPTVLSSYLFQL